MWTPSHPSEAAIQEHFLWMLPGSAENWIPPNAVQQSTPRKMKIKNMKARRLTKSVGSSRCWSGCILIMIALACFALSPTMRAVSPPPDGGYPNRTTAEGDNALFNLTVGVDNTALGFDTLWSNVTGGYNTATGEQTLYSNVSGNYNTGTGYRALYSNTGSKNTADGFRALFSNMDGSANTASGFQALYFNTGTGNTAVGQDALYYNVAGGLNTAVGDLALFKNSSASGNVAVGYQALSNNTTAGITGQASVAVGYKALAHQNGTLAANNAVGQNALFNALDGHYNNGFGWQALFNVTSGFDNTAIGDGAGSGINTGNFNTCLGDDTCGSVSSASGVLCIGSGVSGENVDNRTYIRNVATTGQNNSVYVTIDLVTGRLGFVNFSSERYKENIKPMEKVSEAILGLKPITYRYKPGVDAANLPQFGLSAEQVAKANPDLVIYDQKGLPLTVRYDAINVMLLNEFLKEHRKVEEQEATISELKKDFQVTTTQQQEQIRALAATLKEQATQIQKVSAQLETNRLAPKVVADR
jgi:trimeric autotransporter adhesin